MRMVVLVVLTLLVGSVATAQPPKLEVCADIGYTFSEGFDFSPVEVNGVTYDHVDPESGLSYGFNVGFFVNRFTEIGFMMSQEQSTLIAGGRGVGKRDFVDLDLNNYHGYLAYNFGYNPKMIPYVLFGMGATHYITGDYQGGDVDNETRFSTTWGGGVKMFPAGRLGARFAARWTPTYIHTNASGWWCDPWGCWTVGSAEYSHQFELSAGAVYRY